MKWLIISLIVITTVPASVVAEPGSEHAEPAQIESPTEPTFDEERHRRFVQGEILIADAVAAAAGVGVALAEPFGTSDRTGRIGRGVATMMGIGLLAGPSIHWANQHYAHGGGSAAVRAFTPPLTALVGLLAYCMGTDSQDGCARDGAVYGSGAGVLAAALLDGLLIPRLPLPPHSEPSTWYGWQILIADGAGLGLGALMALRADEPTLAEGMVVFPFAGWLGVWLIGTIASPIIHFAHLEWLSGLSSLALRTFGSPLLGLGGLIAYCGAVGGESGCQSVGFSWGLLGGALFVSALDTLAFARKKIETDTALYVGPGVVGDAPGFVLQMPLW